MREREADQPTETRPYGDCFYIGIHGDPAEMLIFLTTLYFLCIFRDHRPFSEKI